MIDPIDAPAGESRSVEHDVVRAARHVLAVRQPVGGRPINEALAGDPREVLDDRLILRQFLVIADTGWCAEDISTVARYRYRCSRGVGWHERNLRRGCLVAAGAGRGIQRRAEQT